MDAPTATVKRNRCHGGEIRPMADRTRKLQAMTAGRCVARHGRDGLTHGLNSGAVWFLAEKCVKCKQESKDACCSTREVEAMSGVRDEETAHICLG